MRNILLIAKREYLEQIRGRAFLFSTVLVPLLIAGMVGWSAMNSGKAGTGKHLAIAADNVALAGQVRREMLYDTSAKLTVDVVAPATPEDRAPCGCSSRARPSTEFSPSIPPLPEPSQRPTLRSP